MNASLTLHLPLLLPVVVSGTPSDELRDACCRCPSIRLPPSVSDGGASQTPRHLAFMPRPAATKWCTPSEDATSYKTTTEHAWTAAVAPHYAAMMLDAVRAWILRSLANDSVEDALYLRLGDDMVYLMGDPREIIAANRIPDSSLDGLEHDTLQAAFGAFVEVTRSEVPPAHEGGVSVDVLAKPVLRRFVPFVWNSSSDAARRCFDAGGVVLFNSDAVTVVGRATVAPPCDTQCHSLPQLTTVAVAAIMKGYPEIDFTDGTITPSSEPLSAAAIAHLDALRVSLDSDFRSLVIPDGIEAWCLIQVPSLQGRSDLTEEQRRLAFLVPNTLLWKSTHLAQERTIQPKHRPIAQAIANDLLLRLPSALEAYAGDSIAFTSASGYGNSAASPSNRFDDEPDLFVTGGNSRLFGGPMEHPAEGTGFTPPSPPLLPPVTKKEAEVADDPAPVAPPVKEVVKDGAKAKRVGSKRKRK